MIRKLVPGVIILAAATLWIAGCAGRTAVTGPTADVSSPEASQVSTMEGYNSVYNPAHIGSAEAWKMVSEDSGAIVLDVRSQESYLERHVSIAINIPFESLSSTVDAYIPDKERVIICYCFCDDKGGPALSAVELLKGLGYTNVYYTEPGDEWTYESAPADETQEDTSMHKVISGEEAKKMVGNDPGIILLDVRNQDEYDAGYIDGSLLIPVSELASRLSELPDKNATIIVYCRSGMRSASAYKLLTSNGYKNVYDMQSYFNWPG